MTDQMGKAASRGDTASLLELLEDGADVNELDADGRTPVLLATRGNHVDTVRALVEAGADPNIADRQGTTALQHARRRGYVEIARILENAGAR